MSDKFKKFMKEWVIPLGIEVIVVFLIIKFVIFLVNVPTGSMIPTIDEKSWLFATRTHNVEKELKRGDVVIFNSEEEQKVLIKRLIGMPGENVVVNEEGEVFIDGELLEEDYVVNQKFGYQGEFDVPEGHYLFFGDNRNGSLDARYWDDPYIPEEEIMGEGRFIIFPFKDFGVIK